MNMQQHAAQFVNGLLGRLGLRLSRVQDADTILDPAARSIAKGLSTRAHNTRENMDAFYSDPHLMTHYFTKERLKFYGEVRLQLTKLNLRPADVLDVGCGSGHLLADLASLYPEASSMGVDFSPESIRLARQLHPHKAFDVMSIFELKNLGRQFDLVLCTEVIEHLEDADVAVDNLCSVCRPGGTVAITVPHGRRDTFAGHFNFWTPESFRREFRRLNPQVEEFDNYLFISIRRP